MHLRLRLRPLPLVSRGRDTTAGQGLLLQSFCIPAIHGGQMQEVEQRRERLPREGA
ncbi:MAG: hypothetical protein BMS9Abin14_806 [Gammaproteobacteria bacterium]|nr:MAG: hypothetical protein BMS9Abin14_806 [Gammaproteobacteria bacterium]